MATINGTPGNDTLTSTGIGDILAGGAGNDTYIVNDPADQVVETKNGAVTLLSATAAGVQSNGTSDSASLSADGSKLVFTSTASNLVAGVSGQQVYIKDLHTGVVSLVSSSGSGTAGNGASTEAHISADGTKVVFTSAATNFTLLDVNGNTDVFVKDLATGNVSKLSDGLLLNLAANGDSSSPSISADGSLVAYASQASNMSLLDLNGAQDIYVKNTGTGLLSLVLSGSGGVVSNNDSFSPVISQDGSKIVFASTATNLVSGDTNGVEDIFVYNINTGTTTLVSHSSAGVEGNQASFAPVFSDDANQVAFLSTATNLAPGATGGTQSLYVTNLTTGVTSLVSSDVAGGQANGLSFAPSFSHDGTMVVFASYGTNLVTGDLNTFPDIFVKNLVTGAVYSISNDSEGVQANGFSGSPVFSADDSQIIFSSDASNLVAGDTNGARDIFVKDIVTDGGGIDTVQSSVTYTLGNNIENLTLTGSANINGTGNGLDNYILGNSGSNLLTGAGGNDTLDGGAGGTDTLVGGAGNDLYLVSNSNTVVTEGAGGGDDTIQSSVSYNAVANVESLQLVGSGNINATGDANGNNLVGNSGNNVLDGGAGNDTLNGGPGGADTLIGGLGDDTFIVSSSGTVVVEAAGGGNDTVQSSADFTLSANVENLVLTGSGNINGTGNSGDNYITGNSGANTLSGAAGNDTLDGGTGNDTLIGGTGNDTYYVSTSDKIIEAVGAGTDTAIASSSYTLGANVENLILQGSGNINGTGNSNNNHIVGNSGNNVLNGGAGNDTFDGGAGNDTLIGGTGNDTFLVSTSDVIVEAAGGGNDTAIAANSSYTLGANVENLILQGSADLNGTGNSGDNKITGNSGSNLLAGGGGNDTLDGGVGGTDTLVGGAGDDLYLVSNPATVIVELPGGGNDTVHSSVSYTLSDNIENLVLTGTANLNGTGNDQGDYLLGNAGKNVLTGGAGNDTIDGAGDNDTLIGGLGNDTYYVSTNDKITEAVNAGTDTAIAAHSSYTLGANVENLILAGTGNINGSGNGLANTITGNSGNNILNGGAGSDTLIGGLGDDTYIANTTDVIVEAVNAGTDSVRASSSYTLGANLENLTLTGTANSNGSGNDLNNLIIGNSGINSLNGNAGNDTLDGGGGNDTLKGGAGDDLYIVGAGTVVREYANNGIDTVQSSVSYTLTANVENLILTGTGNLNGVGNNLNNVITGNSGNNILNGGTGNDTLVGGLGNDTYYVSTSDRIIEGVHGGTDTAIASSSYTLRDNMENLILQGTGNLTGTGNSQDNYLTGNAGNNTLSGGAGNDTINGGLGQDTLIGGTGNDTYYFVDGEDTIVEAAGGGIDTVLVGTTYALTNTDNLENITLTGFSSINATGNDADNYLLGNDGKNILTGGIGNDTLNGGNANDTLIGGVGNDSYYVSTSDTIIEAAGEGIDTAYAASNYTLAANVENLVLTGNLYIKGTGNTLDNVITGNSGNNLLTGGGGSDTFVFNTAPDSVTNHDTITDFGADDKLNLSHLIYDQAGPVGALNSTAFVSGAGLTAGQDANDRLVYNTTTGNLYYDADGSGAGSSVLIATLGTSTHPDLTVAQIQVV